MGGLVVGRWEVAAVRLKARHSEEPGLPEVVAALALAELLGCCQREPVLASCSAEVFLEAERLQDQSVQHIHENVAGPQDFGTLREHL